MTPEQLDEIEKLAATWLETEKSFYARGRDYAMHQFIIAMRMNALPLVKALREAQKERDVLQAVLNDWQRFGMEREKERDEARAEVERLRSVLRLLWEEATDEGRCQYEYAPGCYGHHISKPCREVIKAVLKGDE